MRSSSRVDARDAMATIEALEALGKRGAGTDAERRAAGWLADRLAGPEREVLVETFWCRPNWALTHAWHGTLAVTGSLISLASAAAGIAILAVALISVLCDALIGVSLGRRLTPERASQNVIASPVERTRPAVRLVVTANYDTGRVGVAYRAKPVTARLVKALRGATPGWIGWLTIGTGWLLGLAVLRQTGVTSQAIGALQFPPTVGLLIGLALLIDLATGQWSPAANDNSTGVSAAIELADEVAATPPGNLAVEVVLSGAGDGDRIGLRRYLRSTRDAPRRGRRRGAASGLQTIVLAIEACGAGTPRFWQSDGALLPLRYSATLRRVAAQIAADEAHLELSSHRGRSSTGAYPARAAGLSALTIGCLDNREIAPQSHRKTDTRAALEHRSLDRTIQFALLLVDAIDDEVGKSRPRSAAPA